MKNTNENMISQDLLDDYAYLVKLWYDYADKGLVKEAGELVKIKPELLDICQNIDAKIEAEKEDAEEYGESYNYDRTDILEAAFHNMMRANDYLNSPTSQGVLFHTDRWYMADLYGAVASLKDDGIIPQWVFPDYQYLANAIKNEVFKDHSAQNEQITQAIEYYCENNEYCNPIEFSKDDVKNLSIAVLYTDENLYANILKKNNKSCLEANQILEILCRAGVLSAEDFEDMSCASSMNSDIYKKIKRLAQVVVF